jgi:hypothetical protein
MQMKKINTGRALLGGLVAAVIIDMIEGVMNGVVLKEDWKAAVVALGKSGEVTGTDIAIYNFVGLLVGIVGVWLYCALISRYGTGSVTAAKAGLVVWALFSGLPSLLQVPAGLTPPHLMGIVVLVDFIAILLGITMGALLYREEGVPQAEAAHA